MIKQKLVVKTTAGFVVRANFVDRAKVQCAESAVEDSRLPPSGGRTAFLFCEDFGEIA